MSNNMYDWAARGACRTTDPDSLFVQGAAQNRAKAVCMSCSVRTECLADALDNRIEFGVWGGMTERERRALLRRRPNVGSWRRLLETARAEHQRVIAIAAARSEAAEVSSRQAG
jgi:WhiB family redox-sensing transcriptional regulator